MTIQRLPLRPKKKPAPAGVTANVDVLDRLCPVCAATAGASCRTRHPDGSLGGKRSKPHAARATHLGDPGPLPKKQSKKATAKKAKTRTTRGKANKAGADGAEPVDPQWAKLVAWQSRLQAIRDAAAHRGNKLPKVTAAERKYRTALSAYMKERAATPGTPEHQHRIEQVEVARVRDLAHRTIHSGGPDFMDRRDW